MTPQPALATGTDPATDISVRHLWVAAGHSLCELEAGKDGAERAESLTPHTPVCGPCLLLIGLLRRQACAFLELAGNEAVPASVREGWRLLDKTPWRARMDLAGFLRDNPDLDAHNQYDAIRYAVDPGTVDAFAEEITTGRPAGR